MGAGRVYQDVNSLIQIVTTFRRRFGLAVMPVLAVLVVLLAQPGLPARAWRFLCLLEASRYADGVSGQITLWERVIYSFILAA